MNYDWWMSLSSLEMLRYDYQEDSSNGRKFGISAVLLPFWDVMEKPMLYKVSKYSLKKLRGDLQTLVMLVAFAPFVLTCCFPRLLGFLRLYEREKA